jgi:hypothetical protein
METQTAASEIIETLLTTNTLEEWEFLYMHATSYFRMRITPDAIRKGYQYKFVVRSAAADSQRIRSLSKALRKATLERTLRNLDVRYALTIRDTKQKDVLTLFMDFGNQHISINGTVYHANSELAGWFKEMARDVVKTS